MGNIKETQENYITDLQKTGFFLSNSNFPIKCLKQPTDINICMFNSVVLCQRTCTDGFAESD